MALPGRVAALALLCASLVGCGGDSGRAERVRANLFANEIACQHTGGCLAVSEVTKMASGLWRVHYAASSDTPDYCLLIDLDRFEVGQGKFKGVGAIDCNYAPE